MTSLDVVFSNEIAEMKEKLGRMEVSMYSFGSSIHDKVEAELKELKTKLNNSGDFVVVNTRDEQILADIQELKDENKLLKSVIKEVYKSLYDVLPYASQQHFLNKYPKVDEMLEELK